jgi:AraC-like DNA-binding protein
VEDVVEVMRTEPEDLSAVVLDSLAHRRVIVDRDTRRLVGKTIELSNAVRSLSELCRQLFVSRRALGRRFSDRRLPPPSHWLQFSRVLRVSLRLQSSQLPVAQVATTFGYPDAFTLSNQMVRMIGVRPSDVRDCLGWEWILEAWIRKESRSGYFSPDGARESGATLSQLPPHRRIRRRGQGALS